MTDTRFTPEEFARLLALPADHPERRRAEADPRFDAWFTRIVVNACRMSLRARSRRRLREMAAGPAPGECQGLASQLADRDVLERAFDRLSADERTLLVLHHLEARPLTEIALLLDVRLGTVKSRLHAARRALERALEVESR